MEISIGIIAYNEEKNIRRLLDSINDQRLEDVDIKQIIIVSSGSDDKTDDMIKEYSKKQKKIRLITEKKRTGKANAINHFIKASKSDNLLLLSADIVLKNDFIKNISEPLKDKTIGVVASHPIPIKKSFSILNRLIQYQWYIHDKISQKNPKFGEAILFKKVFNKLSITSVDEEEIAMIIKDKGLKPFYQKDAIVYNKGPENIKDFLLQRRRIHSGHLQLKKKGYFVSSIDYLLIFKEIIKSMFNFNIMVIFLAILLESYARFLGLKDFITKKDHSIWKIAISTK